MSTITYLEADAALTKAVDGLAVMIIKERAHARAQVLLDARTAIHEQRSRIRSAALANSDKVYQEIESDLNDAASDLRKAKSRAKELAANLEAAAAALGALTKILASIGL